MWANDAFIVHYYVQAAASPLKQPVQSVPHTVVAACPLAKTLPDGLAPHLMSAFTAAVSLGTAVTQTDCARAMRHIDLLEMTLRQLI
jgi:hypothetical protein